MIWTKLYALVYYISSIPVRRLEAVKLDVIKCGVDETDTVVGPVQNHQYPWLGVLFYSLYGGLGETRSVTTVVLIHIEFVIASSADIGPMPKRAFRDKARVLLGEGWESGGRRVRNYIVHPEYGETINSVAIVHLAQPVRDPKIIPICPPPERLRNPLFWVVKFDDKLDAMKKSMLPMAEVSAEMCRDFYLDKSLYEAKRRPSFVKCAVSLEDKTPCVWGAGAALVSRDVWGRWQLLGLGVHGPGCGAPARFLDMLRYYPWIEDSLDKFQRITISQIHKHKYVLRSGVPFGSLMRFGDCDDYEKQNLIYRDNVDLSVDNNNVKRIKYNMTIFDTVQYTCVVFELRHASASAEMRVRHFCPRGPGGAACYAYRGTRFDISVDVIFTENCLLDIRAYGLHVNMSLLDIELWKWEEGTYYEDFRLTPVEYRGPQTWTLFGFEPLDEKMWVPDYDRWSTTPFTYDITTERFSQTAKGNVDKTASMMTRIRSSTNRILQAFAERADCPIIRHWDLAHAPVLASPRQYWLYGTFVTNISYKAYQDYFEFVASSHVPTTTTRTLKKFSKKTRRWYWYESVGNYLAKAAKDVEEFFKGFFALFG